MDVVYEAHVQMQIAWSSVQHTKSLDYHIIKTNIRLSLKSVVKKMTPGVKKKNSFNSWSKTFYILVFDYSIFIGTNLY